MRKQFITWLSWSFFCSFIYLTTGFIYELCDTWISTSGGFITYIMDLSINGPLRIAIESLYPNYPPDFYANLICRMPVYYFVYFGLVFAPILASQNNKYQRKVLFVLSAFTVVFVFIVSFISPALF